MPDKVTYEYAVIRVVPRVEREEFLNIGVILFSKRKRYLGMKYQVDEARLKAFSKELDLDQLKSYLKAWEEVCAGHPKGGTIGRQDQAYRFRWLTANRSTIVQSSRPHPGICDNPERLLAELFDFYVA